VQCLAAVRDHPACRFLCAGLAFGRQAKIEYDGDGEGMARICAALYSDAASFMAQHRLAEKESMVRGRASSLFAKACAALAGGLILLAACAPQVAREGLATVTPTIATDVFVTRDGLRLPLRHWDADHPRAVIVALHGMSDYSEAFDMPGPWWAAHDI